MRNLLSMMLGATLALTASAYAADDSHHPKGMSGSDRPMGMMAGMMRCPLMGGHVEGTLAFLKTELKITAGQAGAWDAFASAYRETSAADDRGAMMDGDEMTSDAQRGGGMRGKGMMSKPLPERTAMHMQAMERHLASMKKLQAALTPLYGALDAEQKKTADGLLPMLMMPRHMM